MSKIHTHLSTILRLKELISLIGESSEVTGRDTIPRAKSIRSTTVSMNSIVSTSLNVDNFLLCSRAFLDFAIAEGDPSPRVWSEIPKDQKTKKKNLLLLQTIVVVSLPPLQIFCVCETLSGSLKLL